MFDPLSHRVARSAARPAARFAMPVLAALVAALAACTGYQLSDRSINFNDALQDLDNRQVLLNAVRASKRYPPYFTSISQINATGELDGSQVNLTLPFGPVGHNVFSAAPMIKAGTGLTVSTNPLDTQDFYEGYMAPVNTALIGYYLDFGWPPQLIYHTFIREVDLPMSLVEGIKGVAFNYIDQVNNRCGSGFVRLTPSTPTTCLDNLADLGLAAAVLGGGGAKGCPALAELNSLPARDVTTAPDDTVHFINDPTQPCDFAAFQLLAALAEKLQLAVIKVPPPKAAATPVVIPTTDKNVSVKVQNEAASSPAPKVKFAFNTVADPCVPPAKPDADRGPVHSARHDAGAGEALAPQIATLDKSPAQQPMVLPDNTQPAAPAAAEPAAPAARTWQSVICNDEKNLVNIVVRSPEAIVFYLGQLISAEYPTSPGGPTAHFVARVHGQYTSLPLFAVEKGSSSGDAEVSVALDGDTYYIPKDQNYNSTMHLLTLTEQVIALQKKGTQFPTIPTVQVLGQ